MPRYTPNTAFILDAIPAGGFLDTSSLQGPGMRRIDTLVYTRNVGAPLAGYGRTRNPTSGIQSFEDDDDRFERLESISPPPRHSARTPPRSPSPVAPLSSLHAPIPPPSQIPRRPPSPAPVERSSCLEAPPPSQIPRRPPSPAPVKRSSCLEAPIPHASHIPRRSPPIENSLEVKTRPARQPRRSVPVNQPPRRSTRLTLRNARSFEQLSSTESSVRRTSARIRKNSTDTKNAPQCERSSTNIPNKTGDRKRKRVESATSDQPKPKARRIPSHQPKTASQSSSKDFEVELAVSLPKSIRRPNPLGLAGIRVNTRSSQAIPGSQSILKMELPLSSQDSMRQLSQRPKAKPSKRLPHQLLSASQSSSNMPMSTFDSGSSSVRSSRRLQAKRIMSSQTA